MRKDQVTAHVLIWEGNWAGGGLKQEGTAGRGAVRGRPCQCSDAHQRAVLGGVVLGWKGPQLLITIQCKACWAAASHHCFLCPKHQQNLTYSVAEPDMFRKCSKTVLICSELHPD